jgi:hypothetical protein
VGNPRLADWATHETIAGKPTSTAKQAISLLATLPSTFPICIATLFADLGSDFPSKLTVQSV